jgi:hypothetical protein
MSSEILVHQINKHNAVLGPAAHAWVEFDLPYNTYYVVFVID